MFVLFTLPEDIILPLRVIVWYSKATEISLGKTTYKWGTTDCVILMEGGEICVLF